MRQQGMKTKESLPVAIIGAGPVGLAAAAQLAVRNQPFILFEVGTSVATNVQSWKHVRLFSPWRYNIDRAARALLTQTGWRSPDDEVLPTGEALYNDYLLPLSALPAIRPHLLCGHRVIAIGRTNADKMKTAGRDALPYTITVAHGVDTHQFQAKAIIDTSGTWQTPNPIGAGGTFAIGEIENSNRIYYGIPDVDHTLTDRYKNKRVLVVGGGHSAINVILALDQLKDKYPATSIHWVLRKQRVEAAYGGQEKDALAARGALGIMIEQRVRAGRITVHTPFQIRQISATGNSLQVNGVHHERPAVLTDIDEIISNTGSRPDFSFLREVRVGIDASLESVSALADLIDPNIHSCGTVRPHGVRELAHPDSNFYIAGAKSYGRAPTFLMATGYEQVRSIVAAIDGDMTAAWRVELDLPETGVCSVPQATAISGCCTPTSGETTCCTPSTSAVAPDSTCCEQPADGAPCCNK